MFWSRKIIREDILPRDTLAWILFAQGLALLPLFFYLPLWLPLLWVSVTFWRIQIYRGVWVFPNQLVKFLLGGLSISLLYVSFHGSFGVEPMVSFLLCGFILKLIEVYKRKDATILLYICYLAIAAFFLFSQTFAAAIYVLFCLWIILAAQRSVHLARKQSIKRQLLFSGRLLLQALPLMMVLFVVMPRLGQFWSVPSAKAASTGFSTSMSPGTLAQLIKSNDLAFRVTFESEGDGRGQLPASQRYWRGLTLEHYDGRTWHQRKFRGEGVFGSVQRNAESPLNWDLSDADSSKRLKYSIILEPHNHSWLFSLMVPIRVQSPQSFSIGFHEDKLLLSERPVSSRVQYQVESVLEYKVDASELESQSRIRNLQIPAQRNPRTERLIEGWKSQGLNSEQVIGETLKIFNQDFTYTLDPPLLGASSVDEFLFVSKRGFCEHFASAFVYMMRLSDIPSRVVVGYLGGEENNVENYLMVRQSDAHAWAEVWLPGKGWVRVDPTAAVAPSRIEEGLESAIGASELAQLRGRFSAEFMSALVHYWDSMSYQWHRWILDYDEDSQQSLFEKLLGGAQAWRIALFFMGVPALLLLIYFVLLLRNRSLRGLAPALRIYLKFVGKLQRRGLQRELGETPNAYAQRALQRFPQWRSSILLITQLYCHIAYRNHHEKTRDLAREVKIFPPAKVRAHHHKTR